MNKIPFQGLGAAIFQKLQLCLSGLRDNKEFPDVKGLVPVGVGGKNVAFIQFRDSFPAFDAAFLYGNQIDDHTTLNHPVGVVHVFSQQRVGTLQLDLG